MTLKQFKILKLSVVFILAMIVGQAIVYHNYIISVVAMALAIMVIFYFRGRVKEVIADERDYEVGGRAAILTIQVFSWLTVILLFSLLVYYEANPVPEIMTAVMVLAYSACALMVIYTLFFRYYNKIAFLEKKFFYLVAGFLILLFVAVLGLRLISGEDNWVCDGGRWISHGHPDFPAPSAECKK